jgi:hypothetical protein
MARSRSVRESAALDLLNDADELGAAVICGFGSKASGVAGDFGDLSFVKHHSVMQCSIERRDRRRTRCARRGVSIPLKLGFSSVAERREGG